MSTVAVAVVVVGLDRKGTLIRLPRTEIRRAYQRKVAWTCHGDHKGSQLSWTARSTTPTGDCVHGPEPKACFSAIPLDHPQSRDPFIGGPWATIFWYFLQ